VSLVTPLLLLSLAAGPGASPAPVPVRLVEASASSAGRLVAGTLVASERATISTRLAARVRRLHVREGDRVKRGALLVSLAAEDLREQLAAARAGRDAAAAHEKRIRSLLADRAATPAELEQAVAQRAQADAALAAAEATLGYAELRAPFAGVVQARRVEEGDFVGPGTPLVELEGPRGLEVQATLSEEEAGTVRIGRRLTVEAGGVRGTAEVTALAPGGDPVSHRVALRARIVTGGEGLRSGTFARLQLPAGPSSGALSIPRSALVERGDLTGAFVVEDGRARLRWLAVGEPAGDRIAIRAGLRAGERVVDAPGALADGASVEVRDGR
jgi:RND family efflux transporter MFP subunit